MYQVIITKQISFRKIAFIFSTVDIPRYQILYSAVFKTQQHTSLAACKAVSASCFLSPLLTQIEVIRIRAF